MSLLKYRESVHNVDGRSPLGWHRAAIDGAPFRGPAPMYKEEDFENKTERVHDGKVRVFRLWVEEDRKAYEDIIDRASNRWYTIIRDEPRFVEKEANFVVLCVWAETYIEAASQS